MCYPSSLFVEARVWQLLKNITHCLCLSTRGGKGGGTKNEGVFERMGMGEGSSEKGGAWFRGWDGSG